ncbi:hypothetical protein EDEG_01528 [Edhazardia aedis USNM 41457]|uniref:PHD-type domain-containing protein n=1 Tax=Edhazardia aedis (strain USNM 41457) TaxID=1003232 RepID=J8ZWY1_EDHAE|nr:hypothetical protein EDEG_01528 [Edhazardia aedis USNM 41457]|eukprot:EJW04178.1 hypothetical protein EDEG_01528 [Edhazardia aedis USNM 41457]
MIFKNKLESLDETPAKIQQTLTEILYLKHKNISHYEILKKIDAAEQIDEISTSFVKILKSEKEIEKSLQNLLNFIDDQILDIENELDLFKENCALAAIEAKASSINALVDEVFCICRKEARGNMIGCDNTDCKIEWFHLECVGLVTPPKGKWQCPECRKK